MRPSGPLSDIKGVNAPGLILEEEPAAVMMAAIRSGFI
jgi:hypothetical protein